MGQDQIVISPPSTITAHSFLGVTLLLFYLSSSDQEMK